MSILPSETATEGKSRDAVAYIPLYTAAEGPPAVEAGGKQPFRYKEAGLFAWSSRGHITINGSNSTVQSGEKMSGGGQAGEMPGGNHSSGSLRQQKENFGNCGKATSRNRCGELEPKFLPARYDMNIHASWEGEIQLQQPL